MEQLSTLLAEIFREETLILGVFGGLRQKSNSCRKVSLRPILLQEELHYQAEYHHEKKVLHENLTKETALSLCLRLLETDYKQLSLFTKEADYEVLASKKDKPLLRKHPPTKTLSATNLSHNKEKQYLIPDKTPCDFLIALGVMTRDGQVKQKHYNKFRQINRFLEIVSDVLPYLTEKRNANGAVIPLKIIDFGCGKAYLTFALYYYLKLQLKRPVEIVGLDLKEDVISFCNETAKTLHYDGLLFQRGDIARYQGTATADMVVTLHACDTATDFALMKAVSWNASVILSVPCCQHELFSQIKNTVNAPILNQGILRERFCAILTDSLRALKLEEKGYDVTMLEFTSLEHTAKNIMLRAVGTASPAAMKKAGEDYQALKEFWQVNPAIDSM